MILLKKQKGNAILKAQTNSLYSALLRDRYPVATARLEAESLPAGGTVHFFRTPIGTVVSAELHGIALLQDLSFSVGSGSRMTTANLAPLEREGKCTVFVGITHRFSVEDLVEKTVTLCATADAAPSLLAQGRVRPMAQNA